MKKILVLEDEEPVRLNIKAILESGGFEPIVAPNGAAGLELAKAQMPDLIVCDIMMPDMDGYAVLSEVRQYPATATIPFIFLTAKTTREDLRQGMNLGADDYLTKPFRRTELLEAIAARFARQNTLANLQEKIQQLEELNNEKDELIRNVSHDLRTPLSTIKLIADSLKIIPNQVQQEQYLTILETVCDQGNDLINNLLDLQQLESHDRPVLFEVFSLQEWLGGLIAVFEVRACDRQQKFKTNLPLDFPPLISDPISLKRILTELLNNACKYTPPGGEIGLEVVFQPTESAQSTPVTTFIIQNQAEIYQIELPRIFDKFYRGHNINRQQVGSGLGLAIVKKLVEQLQATIQVESSQGWTTFTIQLPSKTIFTNGN
jgi:two-component system, sensor histidine kinase and response regulator